MENTRKQFLETFFKDNKQGYVGFSFIQHEKEFPITSKKTGIEYMKSYYHYDVMMKQDDIDAFQNFTYHKSCDYYMPCNSFANNKVHKDTVFTLDAIVLHSYIGNIYYDSLTDSSLKSECIQNAMKMKSFLEKAIREVWNTEVVKEGYPKVNALHSLGDGFDFWFSFTSASYKLRNAYEKAAKALLKRMREFCMEYPELKYIHFEDCMSGKLDGEYRIPNTHNTSLDYDTKLTMFTNEHASFIEAAGLCPKGPGRRTICVAKSRLNFIKRLYELRVENGDPIYRNNFLFCIFNTQYEALGYEETMRLVNQMNDSFEKPIQKRWVKRYLAPSVRKSGYRLSNKKLHEILQVTEEELLILFPPKEVRYTRSYESLNTSTVRRILKLARNTEMTKKEIANEVGYSEPTIATVLRKHKVKSYKERRREGVRVLLALGRSPKEIMKIWNISKASVSRLKHEMTEEEMRQIRIMEGSEEMTEDEIIDMADSMLGEWEEKNPRKDEMTKEEYREYMKALGKEKEKVKDELSEESGFSKKRIYRILIHSGLKEFFMEKLGEGLRSVVYDSLEFKYETEFDFFRKFMSKSVLHFYKRKAERQYYQNRQNKTRAKMLRILKAEGISLSAS